MCQILQGQSSPLAKPASVHPAQHLALGIPASALECTSESNYNFFLSGSFSSQTHSSSAFLLGWENGRGWEAREDARQGVQGKEHGRKKERGWLEMLWVTP